MFIAIIGTRLSGKSTVETYLTERGFIPVKVISRTPEHEGGLKRVLSFASAAELLQHVTRNWNQDFVTQDLRTEQAIRMFIKRPFFMLLSIDGPISDRFRRANNLQKHVTLHVVNNFDSVAALRSYLDDINILDADRLRPSWDSYFMTLASLASMRSNCMKRRVGAILVRNKRIVATGYNGTPLGLKNCNEGGCARCNGLNERESCLCLHAEENALLEAGRERVSGATLYCNTCPCLTCTVKIVQTGVKEVVYNLSYKVDDESAKLFHSAGVTLRRHRQAS
ncbi:cytidine deaminase-like protein [Russula aff. rugulosa BPL654]|nr:cytidine deaminase-like protein [Russula aff. rugulosa BPL654]